MPYIINRYNGQELVVLEDGTLDTTTSLSLVGRNYVGYGEIQNENFVYLLENFANNKPPRGPVSGQLWFNSELNLVYVYDSEKKWVLVGASAVSATAPETPAPGSLWYRTDLGVLNLYNGQEWKAIAPEVAPGFGETKAKTVVIKDTESVDNPIVQLTIDGTPIAIISGREFTPATENIISGFTKIYNGVTLNSQVFFHGPLKGNAETATKLETKRTINGVGFDGSSNITITATTPGSLIRGDYILGDNFNGAGNTTWSINASSDVVNGSIVARDTIGNFRANQITANLVGNVVGNVQITTGFSTFNEVRAAKFIGASLTGNAGSATKLETARQINGVDFDGTRNITVGASATTLTGNFLANNVLSSSLVQVGKLLDLSVASAGVVIGDGDDIKIGFRSSNPYFKSQITGRSIDIELTDTSYINPNPRIRFLPSTIASDLGGESIPTLTKEGAGEVNLGMFSRRWNKFYTNETYSSSVYSDSITPMSGTTTTLNGSLVVTGDLTVQGSVLAINTTETIVKDKTLTIASGSVSAAAADGAGILVDAANASLLYSVSGDKWTMNKPLDMGSSSIFTTGLFEGTATSARYADLAENYQADNEYLPGTVLEFGGEFEVTLAEDETRRVAGIVSTLPAYLMNSTLQGKHVVAIALQGRVPCKVRGKIRKGDMLVSGGDGYARPTLDPKLGTVIGKALQDFEGSEGIIEVVVGRL